MALEILVMDDGELITRAVAEVTKTATGFKFRQMAVHDAEPFLLAGTFTSQTPESKKAREVANAKALLAKAGS